MKTKHNTSLKHIRVVRGPIKRTELSDYYDLSFEPNIKNLLKLHQVPKFKRRQIKLW